MIKEVTKMKVLCGLRFVPAPGFTDSTDPRIKQIVQSLSSTYATFDGAAFMWNSPDTKQEIMLYEKLRTDLAGANYKIIAHILPAYLDTYDFANMNKYVDTIVVNTHDFAVTGRAFPPCMYEHGGIMDVVDKNLLDVLHRILMAAPFLSTRLVPSVSTVGKKYVFEDATKTSVGDRVDLTKPVEDFPLFKLCQEKNSWTMQLESNTKCEIAFNANKEWIGFESPTSVAFKTELVKKKRLLGIAVVHIEQDDLEACSNDKKPYLLSAVHRGLHVH
ncbi:probable chitinase 10 [Rhipicephalus sanguineus]|uniref:probable chitinase 10 n=1 Tax=Rhipicephalus sanguineus TaxID=34632 RepID=UPI0020C22D32|nr:probable chitinase 10 [Rhipicephalus sanguineus]